MNAKQTWVYHMVNLLPPHGDPLSSFHCVPESWISMQDLESAMALLAYPNEPWRVTQERVRNLEGPGEHWNSYMAQIMYSINFYGGVVRCPGGECNSENNYTEIKSSNTSILRNLLLSTRMGSSFNQLEFHSWFHGQSNSDDPRLSIDDISLQSEGSRSLVSQDVDIDKNVPLDLSIRSRESDQNWTLHDQKRVINIPYGTTSKSSTDENWTLEHREYSPGLVELLPNTGVYIGEAELRHCLRSSKNCCILGRLLTKSIFSKVALKKCRYLGKKWGSLKNRLSPNATDAIVDFALIYGKKHNWQRLNADNIRRTIRYQLMCKRNS